MKRPLSIVFLFVFLFNVGGYYLMNWGLRYHANKELRQRLDEEVLSENELITLKLPITLPYQSDRSFERIDGEFEYNGEFYKLVKQQLKRDTLYVVCIKDHREKQLISDLHNFTKLSNDLPVSSQTLKLLGSLFKDYTSINAIQLMKHQLGWSTHFEFVPMSLHLVSQVIPIHSPPPRVV